MESGEGQRRLSRALWLVSLSRNALVVVSCSLVAFLCRRSASHLNFQLTGNEGSLGRSATGAPASTRLGSQLADCRGFCSGEVRPGLPPLGFPPFSTVVGNRTIQFSEMVSDLGSSVLLVPIVGVLGNVAIAKAFGE